MTGSCCAVISRRPGFRPVTGGVLRAVALSLNRSRTTATVQTSLFNADGKLAAQTTQIQAIR
jgi:hypothetical protein